jgi:hypothetical protein
MTIKTKIRNTQDEKAGVPYYGDIQGEITLDGFTACQRCGALIDRSKAIEIIRNTDLPSIFLFAVYGKHRHDKVLRFCVNCDEVATKAIARLNREMEQSDNESEACCPCLEGAGVGSNKCECKGGNVGCGCCRCDMNECTPREMDTIDIEGGDPLSYYHEDWLRRQLGELP